MPVFRLYNYRMDKLGRPKLDANDKKGVRLDVRISRQEREAFKSAADVSGIPLSIWIRERLRRSAAKELQEANRNIAFLETP